MTQSKGLVYIRRFLIVLAVLAIYIWAFAGLPTLELKETSIEVISAILAGIFSPDWGYVYDPGGEDLLRGLLDTVAIAILGTFIAGILCIPFAFMAANNIMKNKAVVGINKFILSFIRVFP